MMTKNSTMERIQSLVARLKQQAEQNADIEQMLVTVQMLQNELVCHQKGSKTLSTAKVAVVLPSSIWVEASHYEKYAPKPVEELLPAEELKSGQSVVKENGHKDMMAFDPMEIPTLSHQLPHSEPKNKQNKNNVEPESLNDRLKQGKIELMETLKESPIKDLRKAIGINDRFLFISDLFRGDEAMYERSIKTINGFNIFPEAEYWISRELKVKLGWDLSDPTVIHFDQLVKRRFL
jgi:hypothetical protein